VKGARERNSEKAPLWKGLECGIPKKRPSGKGSDAEFLISAYLERGSDAEFLKKRPSGKGSDAESKSAPLERARMRNS